MNPTVQIVLVVLLVLAAAIYSAWLLLSARSRLRLLQWLASSLPESSGRSPMARALRQLTMWLERRQPGGCAGCSGLHSIQTSKRFSR